MEHNKRMEMEQLAPKKLVEAHRLIEEAGELAKEGEFFLNVGEIGCFLPKRVFDTELYREEAIEIIKNEGWDYYDSERKKSVSRTWDALTDDEKEEAIEDVAQNIIDNLDIPYEYREYGPRKGTDTWWSPSRC